MSPVLRFLNKWSATVLYLILIAIPQGGLYRDLRDEEITSLRDEQLGNLPEVTKLFSGGAKVQSQGHQSLAD